MPGLVGIISNKNPEICRKQIRIMFSSMHHEDFYDSGIYEDPLMSVYIGWTSHTNLRISNFPGTSHAQKLKIYLSGEVFNDTDNVLSGKEKGQSTALELVDLYKKNGEKWFEKLNGWFCGVIIDSRYKKISLFNDRYGMHRVFVYESKDGYYFSSDAKAVLAIMPEVGFDPVGLCELLTCGCTIGSHSLYKDIGILPQGVVWTFIGGELKSKRNYFDLKTWTDQDHLNENDYLSRFLKLFGRTVKKYSAGNLPVGVSLTGGLDTRMVMACLKKGGGEFPCYTFGSMYRDTFDVKVAREIAKACGQPYSVLVLGDDFLQNFPLYMEKAIQISGGYIGMSGAAELYMNGMARDIAPVRLTGNYGSELLRGVRAFKFGWPSGDFVSPELLPFLSQARENFQNLVSTDPLTFALFRQAPLQGHGRLSIENSQLQPRTPFMDNDLAQLAYQAPQTMRTGNKLSLAVIARYHPDLLSIPTDRALLGESSDLRTLIRRFEREFLFKAEYWSSHGMPAWLSAISGFKLRKFLHNKFIGQHKFQHFRSWTQEGCLTEYLNETLYQSIKDLPELFIKSRVQTMVDEHLSGRNNYLNEMDMLLMLGLARRNLLKPSRRVDSLVKATPGALPRETLYQGGLN